MTIALIYLTKYESSDLSRQSR